MPEQNTQSTIVEILGGKGKRDTVIIDEETYAKLGKPNWVFADCDPNGSVLAIRPAHQETVNTSVVSRAFDAEGYRFNAQRALGQLTSIVKPGPYHADFMPDNGLAVRLNSRLNSRINGQNTGVQSVDISYDSEN